MNRIGIRVALGWAVMGGMLLSEGSVLAQDAAPAATAAPAAAAETPKPPQTKPAAAAKTTTKKAKPAVPETLPWANKGGDAAGAAANSAGAPAQSVTFGAATNNAGSGVCQGLYEAACREAKECSWLADITLSTGEAVKAHCVSRPEAPSKNAKKKTAPSAQGAAKPAKAAVEKKPAATEQQPSTAMTPAEAAVAAPDEFSSAPSAPAVPQDPSMQ